MGWVHLYGRAPAGGIAGPGKERAVLGIADGAITAEVTGELFSGEAIAGSDAVTIVQ